MVRQLAIALGERSYPIHIGPGLLAESGRLIGACIDPGTCLVVSDETVATLHGEGCCAALRGAGFKPVLATFPPGEPSKTLATAAALWERCATEHVDRAGAIIACGGGVPGDIAGFVAAGWMRGVAFAQVPTTLLAMVDSAVGGKTGVNTPAGKNLVGAFKQPAAVVIDPLVLATMAPREYRTGLAEVLKYGIIHEAAFLDWQDVHAAALADRDPDTTAEAIHVSCRAKAWYVERDETEGGIRAHLNYGHTFAHTLEADGGFTRYLHGEAVGIGMRMAAALAATLGLLEDTNLPARQDSLLTAYGLPLHHIDPDPDVAARRLADLCRLDKKVRGGSVRFVLPRRAGAIEIIANPPVDAVIAAFRSACEAA